MSAGRIVRTGAAVAGFLAVGLWIGGATGRVSALVDVAVSAPAVEPLPGSRAETPRRVLLDGQPALLRRCVAPRSVTLSALRDHYEQVARRESTFAPDKSVPYVAAEQPGQAYVVWVSVADGRRKGVIATAEVDRLDYVLIDGEATDPDATARGFALPGGARAPEQARPGFRLDDGKQGYSMLEMPGTPADAARQLAASLERAGWTVSAEALAGLDEVRVEAPPEASSRVVIPFTREGERGVIIAAPGGRGKSRVTVAIR